MGEKQFLPLGYDHEGVKEEIAFDWDLQQATIKRTFDSSFHANEVLERNKTFDSYSDGYTPSREMQHVASIPIGVIDLWIQKYGVDPTARGNEVLLMRLLNDPEWRELRTGPGHLKFKGR